MFKKIIAYVGICLCVVLCFGMFFIKPVKAQVVVNDEFDNINSSYLPVSFTSNWEPASQTYFSSTLPLEFVKGSSIGYNSAYFSNNTTFGGSFAGQLDISINPTYNTTNNNFIGSQYQYMYNQISRYYLPGALGAIFELKWDSFVFPYSTWNDVNFSIDNFNDYFCILIKKEIIYDSGDSISHLEFATCDFYINYLEDGVLKHRYCYLGIDVIDENDYYRVNILDDLYETIMTLDSSLGFDKIGIINCLISDLTIRFTCLDAPLPVANAQTDPPFILSSMIITDNPYPTEDTNGNPYFINYGMNYDERYFYNKYNFPSLTPTPITPTDMSQWLITSIGGFMNAELFPGFAIGGIFAVMVAFPLVIWFLKIVLGG